MNNEQPYIKYHKDLVPLKLEEMDFGVKYVHIEHSLSPTELKETHFHIYTVRKKYDFESKEGFEDYKRVLKRWAKEGVLYHPSLPKAKKKTKVKRKDLFS